MAPTQVPFHAPTAWGQWDRNYTFGQAITPDVACQITAITFGAGLSISGGSVTASVWTTTGSRVAMGTLNGPFNTDTYYTIPLSSPASLVAGTKYVLSVYSSATSGPYIASNRNSNGVHTHAGGGVVFTLDSGGYHSSGDAYPTSTHDVGETTLWPTVEVAGGGGGGGNDTSVTFNPSSTGRTGTVQSWTVPATGPYKIECWGAEGGKAVSFPAVTPGKGAYRYGTVDLTAGEVIKIIVGQAGIGNTYEGGGGGGSFVYRNTGSQLLCAAGGGGGASRDYSGTDALMTEAANSAPNGGVAGGTGGNAAPQTYGAGGGSWNQTGATSSWSTTGAVRPGSAAKPGVAYDSPSGNSQAYGGAGNSTTNEGGFGGGAGSHGSNSVAGGGGGGYSGGPGGKTSYHGGGGGGSFVHATMSATGGISGARTGSGQVTITLSNLPPTEPTNLSSSGAAPPGGSLPVSWVHNDPEDDPQGGYQLRWRTVVP